MEENTNDISETTEQSSETSEQSVSVSEQSSEVSDVPEINTEPVLEVIENVGESVSNHSDQVNESELDRNDEETEEPTEEVSEEEEIEEQPESTVIQVVENPDSELGYDTVELDIESLNIMAESYADQMLAVTPTSNDYYTFIDSQIADYFSGVMANYPFNEYKAYHLRHWVYNSSYSSYYDDYYYLFYDYPANDCIEIRKAHDSSQYVLTSGSAEILSSTITYGSGSGESDLREGVSYVTWFSALSVIACVCVLYIVHAIFKHLSS